MKPSPHPHRILLRFCIATAVAFGVLTAAGSAHGQPVQVNVQVSTTATLSGYTCMDYSQTGPGGTPYWVCVSVDPIHTSGQSGAPVSVTWTLTGSAGWAFPLAQGISIDSKRNKTNSNGDRAWTVTSATATQYTAINNRETGNKKYQYTINLLKGGYLLTWDPTIMN